MFPIAMPADSLIETSRHEEPSMAWRMGAVVAMNLRTKGVRRMEPREAPHRASGSLNIRSYPNGYHPSGIATFPAGCPVAHNVDPVAHQDLYGPDGDPGPSTQQRSVEAGAAADGHA